MRRATVVLLLALAALAGCGGDSEPAAEPERLGPVALVETLREGGYVVYLRHAITDRSKEDDPVLDLEDCTTQRNLSDEGREQSHEIGDAFRRLSIPIDTVYSSEYCRTRDTAELAFGAYEDEPVLTGFPERSDPTFAQRVRQTEELLARAPGPGQNTVLVAHVKNLEEVAGRTIDEGELAVFEPLGGTSYRYRGQIPATLWPELVDELS
jgi:broad specificity phosphatase PhoE